MDTNRRQRRGRRKGMALAVALVTLLVLTVMGLALGAMGIENLHQMREAGEKTTLLHTANGGLHELMAEMYQAIETGKHVPGDGVEDASDDGKGEYSSSGPGAQYWYTFNVDSKDPYCTNNLRGDNEVKGWNGHIVPKGMALLVINASTEAGGTKTTETVHVGAVVSNRFPFAVASDGEITLEKVTSVIPGEGNVYSNATGGNPNISVKTTVDGQTFSLDKDPDSIKIGDAANSGPQNVSQPPVGIPNVPITDIVDSYSSAGLGGTNPHPYGGPADFPAATDPSIVEYQLVKDGNRFVIRGYSKKNAPQDQFIVNEIKVEYLPASVHVPGNLVVPGTGNVQFPKGLHLFVKGNLLANGSLDQQEVSYPARPGSAPATTLPADQNFIFSTGSVQFNGARGEDFHIIAETGILQNGASKSELTGLLYVRNGSVDFNGQATVTGSIIAKGGVNSDVVAGGATVNYDPEVFKGLEFLNLSLTGRVRPYSWWVVN